MPCGFVDRHRPKRRPTCRPPSRSPTTTDHSTEAGYQFEFFCERCGNGYKSGFNASAAGIGGKVLRGLGGLLGGKLANASPLADQIRDLTESQAKDKALTTAVQEVAPLFN